MRHFSTLSKRVEFSTRGRELRGKVQVERSGMVDEGTGGGRAGRVIAGSLALLSRLFFIAMVSRGFSPRGWLRKGAGGGGRGR